MDNQTEKLLELAQSFMGNDLTPAESILIKNATANYSGVDLKRPHDQPQILNINEVDALRHKYKNDIDGRLLRWLLTDDGAKKLIQRRRLLVSGCIVEPLDLSDVVLPIELGFEYCIFPYGINLERSQALDLSIEQCWLYKIDGSNMIVKGDFSLVKSKINRSIEISGSQITGSFENYVGNCGGIIDADRSTVCKDFILHEVVFRSEGGPSLSLINANIQGKLELRHIDNLGFIRADAASISSNFELIWINFAQGDYPNGLHAPGIVVDGSLIWAPGEVNNKTQLKIPSGKVFVFADNIQSWVEPGNLIIHDFKYKELKDVQVYKETTSLTDDFNTKLRLYWISLQPYWGLYRQPYEEYANWLRSKGHTSEATDVMVVSELNRRSYLSKGKLSLFWSWLLRVTTGYGYRPFLSFLWITAFVLIGSFIFAWAFSNNALALAHNDESPTVFNPLIYSLDTFLPVINFGQTDYWIPSGKGIVGLFTQWYWWLHIAFGWIFSTIAIAGFTGLVRK